MIGRWLALFRSAVANSVKAVFGSRLAAMPQRKSTFTASKPHAANWSASC